MPKQRSVHDKEVERCLLTRSYFHLVQYYILYSVSRCYITVDTYRRLCDFLWENLELIPKGYRDLLNEEDLTSYTTNLEAADGDWIKGRQYPAPSLGVIKKAITKRVKGKGSFIIDNCAN